MSKIGKLPIQIPEGVTVRVEDNKVIVSGPKGELSFPFRKEIIVKITENIINVERKNDTKFAKSLHGLTRSIIANMIKGVTEGYQKVLELVGVGYKATMQGEDMILNVGYSHSVTITHVDGINLEAKENKIFVSGFDKVLVGEIAARIRKVRPPEPYKGKGIRYQGEIIRRKAGKAAKAAGVGA